jgi:hypothetical protein
MDPQLFYLRCILVLIQTVAAAEMPSICAAESQDVPTYLPPLLEEQKKLHNSNPK